MSPSNTSNKVKGWKRGWLGGFVSALLGGGCFSLFLYEAGSRLEGVLLFICVGFRFPALIAPKAGNFNLLLRVTCFWFLTGAVIGYLIKNNTVAIGIWLLVYAISLGISIALFAEIMN